jgi:Carboxypeptidase regulatory-like domain
MRLSLCLVLLCLSTSVFAHAQSPASVPLAGAVLDPSGAAIPHASLHLHNSSSDRSATSDPTGHFTVTIAPGIYDLTVNADGFEAYTRTGISIAPTRNPALNVTLAISTVAEVVTVAADNSTIDTTADANRSALVFKNEQLDTFSDDSDVMQQQLLAMAGTDPSNLPQIFVDGFSNGTLPPKESIREIRINQNPFSAFYDQFGQGRIEILTKPGANQLHGEVRFNFSNADLNSLNPYATGAQPSFSFDNVNANVNGPIGKTSSFYLSAQHRINNNASIIDATTLAPDNVTPVKLSEGVPAPNGFQNYSLRFDHQFGATDTFIGRYTFSQNHQGDAGIGQLVLPTQGYNTSSTNQTLQLTDTHLFGTKVVFDSGFQYIRSHSRQDPISTAPSIVVQGAFSDGGSPTQALHDDQDRLEFQEYFSISQKTHFIRTGMRYRLTRDANLATAGYNGQFTFNSLTAYQITEQGLALHETDQTIRNTCVTGTDGISTCGGATQLSISAGAQNASLLTGDIGLYAEDEWKIVPNFTFNYGLRYETQSAIPIRNDVGPRLGFAWSIAPSQKTKTPAVIIRGGYGIFYQRFASGNILQSLRQNGTAQQAFYLTNPSSDLYNPNATTAPSTAGLSAASSTPYRINPNLKSPSQNQGMIAAEHSFGKLGNVAATFYLRRTNHQFESLNVNAPINGVRPIGGAQDIYQFSSDGVSNGHTFNLNANINLTKKLNFWASFNAGHQESDTSGATSFVSNSYRVQDDAGRASGYSPIQFYGGINLNPNRDLGFNLFIADRSASNFNITTGQDNNGDGQYNDRPAFATDLTRPSVVKTAYGNFDTAPIAGQTIIPVNYGTAPGQLYLELNFNKTIRFGPRPEAPAPAAGSTPTAQPDLPPRRYRVQFGAEIDNPLNSVNPGAPVGVLASPDFGRSISLNNSFNGTSTNRTIAFRTLFGF